MATRVVATLVFAILAVAGSGRSSAAVIGIDDVHGQLQTLATGSSYSEFRSVIANQGHTLVSLSAFGAGNLAGLDAVIVMNSYFGVNTPFGVDEMNAVRSLANQRAVFVDDSTMSTQARRIARLLSEIISGSPRTS